MKSCRKILFVLMLCALAVLGGCAGFNRSPEAPGDLSVEMLDDQRALVSWPESKGADSYEVQYYSVSAGSWTEDGSYRFGSSYVSERWGDADSGMYRVRAVRGNTTSDWTTTPAAPASGTASSSEEVGDAPAAGDIGALPGVPQNVAATEAEVNKALISWSAGTDADSYEVQYYSQRDGEWKTDPDYTSGTSYISTGLSHYDRYSYRVRSVNMYGVSDWAVVTFEKRTTAPPQPDGLRVTPHGENSVMILWNASAGASCYEAQYYSRTGEAWLTDPDYGSGTSYVSTGLSRFDCYEYRIRAVNDAGASGWAYYTYYTTYSAPSAPTGVSVTAYGENSAEISWNQCNYISNYEVQYYSRKTGSWTADGDYPGGISTSYVTTGLSNYESYDFRVRAVNTFGASSWVTVTYVKPAAPAAPTGFTAVPYGEASAQLSWNASAGASGYDVQYYSRKTEEWTADGDYSGGTSYVTTGLGNYESYSFRVRAKNSYGSCSDWVEITYYVPVFYYDAD